MRVIALGIEPRETLRSYGTSNGLVFDEVLSVTGQRVKATATPTLILVDQSGTIKAVWRGKLDESEEKEILRSLGVAEVLETE